MARPICQHRWSTAIICLSCSATAILTCYRAETGEKVWSQRLGNGGTFTSSPVAAGGKLYFANEDGDVYVLKAGPVYELLAQNHLGEVQMATAAITGDMILYRTQHHLIAFKGVK